MAKSKALEDIAVIGMGCRVPGADNIEEYWRVLVNAENHITDIPKERWNNEAFYSEDKDKPGKSYVKKAGFINGYEEWDNKLFDISKSEAEKIDPQQRQVLTCTHMALEDAGITRKQLQGSQTSVFIGVMNDDYKSLTGFDHNADTNYSATGMSTTIISARVSYVYDLRGPCMSVDTACSSSMAAIHLGCQSIRSGECEMAICGGVSCMITPDQFITLCKAGMLSPSGQCQSFCDTADGYGRGEGCGIVILKSYKQALTDKSKIWGIVNTGGNQDGRQTKPITAPSSEQQEELLKKVYSIYSIDPSSLQYIEAHGTGTPVGDPTEINTIGRFIQSYGSKTHKSQQDETNDSHLCENKFQKLQHTSNIQNDHNFIAQEKTKAAILIGSVKSNIGHLESAAGVAALIKVLLMMNNKTFVPSLHVMKDKSNVNKEIVLEPSGLDICTEVAEWKPGTNGNRVCCVNCFGFGGSNMHAVVIQYDREPVDLSIFNAKDQYKVVCTSGLNKAELKGQMEGLSNDLATRKFETRDISFTSVFHRDHFPYKTFVFGKTTEEIQNQLIQKLSYIDSIQVEKERNTRVIFVFCGVGTAWKGMCREMMQQTVFRKTVHEIDNSLKPLTSWSVAEKFLHDTDYNDPFLSHVALFCMQVALFEQWSSWGVRPKAIIGQSVGEVAASYASGALSLKDAIHVIHVRSKTLSSFKGGKMMTARNISVSILEELCQKYENRANIAVHNSPVACTISGDSDAIDQITDDLEQLNKLENFNIFTRTLSVQCAYHSHHMEKATQIIEREINVQNASIRKTDQFSTVTGKLATGDEFQTGKYWADNIRNPVLFRDAVTQSLDKNAFNVFIEIGPEQVLQAHLQNILSNAAEGICLPTMKTNKECESMYTTLNTLFELGAELAWKNILCFDGKIVPVPRYIFQKNSNLYIPAEKKSLLKGIQQVIGAHMYTSQSDDCGTHFTIRLDKDKTPFVYDHYMFKEVLIPGSTYVEAAFEIGRQISALTVFEISISVEFINTFMPRHNERSLIDVEVGKDLDNYHLCFKADKKVLCKGNISLRTEVESNPIDIQTVKERCKTYRTKTETYSCLEKLHFSHGESLRIIQQSWSSSKECIVEFALPESVMRQRTITHMHPSVIDGMFQTFGILSRAGNDQLTLPKGLASIVMNQFPEKVMYGYSFLERSSATENYFNFILLSQGGLVLAEIRNFYTKSMTDASHMPSNTVYKLVWPEMPSPNEPFEEKSGKCRHLKIIGPKRFTSWFEDLQDQSNEFVHSENGDLSKESFSNVASFRSVVYAPSSHVQEMANDGHLLSKCVRESFQNLSQVITTLSELNKDIPVFIVTENVMGHQLGSEPNVCGAELWGMTRSSISEGVYSNLTLIDMTYSKDNFIALNKLLDRKPNSYSEFMINDGKYHYVKVIESNIHDIPFRREINNEISEDIIMKSISATSYTDSFYDARIYQSEDKNKERQCKIHLKRFCLHNSSIFPISNIVASDEDKIEGKTGYTAICIEGTGRRYDSTKDGSSRTTELGFCCPVYISPVVSIPEKCVFDLTSLPIYLPGMVTVGVILWNVVETCSSLSTQNILVIVDDDSKVWIELIKTILSDQSLSARIVSKHKILEMQPNGDTDTVVILAKLTFRHFGLIERQCPTAKHIVSIEEYFSKCQKVYTKMKSEMISLNILKVEDMFTYSALSQKVPNIYKCFVALEKLSFNLCERYLPLEDNKLSTKNVLDLPYPELRLYNESGKENIPLKVTMENVLRPNGCYILVGGLSGLGWELLQLMVAKLGAKYIATLSRHIPTDQHIEEINQIKKTYGCNILNLQCDITDQCQVTEAFKNLRSLVGLHVDIRGIFHGAGVLRDTVLRDMSDEDLEAVLLPKVLGTWNLHVASSNLQLDFFIMHSSIVSVFGNQKQCNYAAGNSFQDSFAHYRRSLGLCGQSINWGPLAVGMAKKVPELEKHLMNQGFHFLTKEEICDCFIFAMMTNEVQLMFGKFDWVQFQKRNMLQINSNKFIDMRKMNPIPESEKEESDARIYHLLRQDPTKHRQEIHNLVRDKIAETFVVEKSDLKDSMNIVKLGLDSMSAMNFTNEIYHATKVKISLATIYNGSTTLDNLTSFIVKAMLENAKSLEPEQKLHDGTTCEYLDGNITFMQKTLLDDFDKDPFSRNIMRQVDFEISGLQLEKSDLHVVFNHLIAINPDIRRTFKRTDDTYYSIVDESRTKINIEDVEFRSICEEDSNDKRGEVRMDITKDIPIRVMTAIRGKRTRVRMFIHAIIGDLSGITYLCRDIGDILKCHLQRKELPFKKPTVNFADALRESVLPQINRLQRFWSSNLNEDCSPFTFSADIGIELEESYWQDISERIPTNVYHRMMNFINNQGISLYNFLISVYMVLLHEYTGKYLIPLVTWADMRAHVPQLQHTFQSCSNAIPVVGDLRELGLVTTYLKRSSDKLYEITQHSAYPYELIKREMKSEELKMHIGRHRFIMENMKHLNNDFKHEKIELKINKTYYKRHSYETSLHIEYDTEQQFVDLQFGYNRKALAEEYAKQVLPRMLELIDKMEQAPYKEVQSLIGCNESVPDSSVSLEGHVQMGNAP